MEPVIENDKPIIENDEAMIENDKARAHELETTRRRFYISAFIEALRLPVQRLGPQAVADKALAAYDGHFSDRPATP